MHSKNVDRFLKSILPLLILTAISGGIISGSNDNEAFFRELPEPAAISISSRLSPNPDTIQYDNDTILLIYTEVESWIGVRFTPIAPFDLKSVYFGVWNQYGNITDGCSLYVVSDDGYGKPDWPDGKLDSFWVAPPVPHAMWIQADMTNPIRFAAGEDFHLIIGLAPGGNYPGPGWWHVFDSDGSTSFRSYVAPESRDAWETALVGDALIKAAGEYISFDTLIYDDEISSYTHDYSDTDIVMTWFVPEGPCTLKTAQMKFASTGEIMFHIWEVPPDTSVYHLGADLLPPFSVDVNDIDQWISIDLGSYNIVLNDTSNGVYIGYELGVNAPDPLIYSDTSEPEDVHSFCYTIRELPDTLLVICPFQVWHPVHNDTIIQDSIASYNYDLMMRLAVAYDSNPAKSTLFRKNDNRLVPDVNSQNERLSKTSLPGRAARRIALLICPTEEFDGELQFAFSDLRRHGYSKGNIIVVYDDDYSTFDLDGDGQNDKDFDAGDPDDIDAAFTALRNMTLTDADTVLIYIVGHGSETKKGSFTFPNERKVYSDAKLKKQIDALTCGVVKIILDYCYSGNTLETIKKKNGGPDRAISASCPKNKACVYMPSPPWAGAIGMLHSLGVWSAICGHKPPKFGKGKIYNVGDKVDADADNNKEISLKEAHDWSQSKLNSWGKYKKVKYKMPYSKAGEVGSCRIWAKDTKPKTKEACTKKTRCNKTTGETIETLKKYSITVHNISVWPIQKFCKTIHKDDVSNMGTIYVNNKDRGVSPPSGWTVSKENITGGAVKICWKLKAGKKDEWGIKAFGEGKQKFTFLYSNDDYKLKKQEVYHFYNRFNDAANSYFADSLVQLDSANCEDCLVSINEVAIQPTNLETEWIEIYNNCPDVVDLSGWIIAHSDSGLEAVQIPMDTLDVFLSPYSYYLWQAPGEFLMDSSDNIYLIDNDSNFIDVIFWDAAESDLAPPPAGYSLAADCDGMVSWGWDLTPSPGYSNFQALDITVNPYAPYTAVVGETLSVIITAVNSDSTEDIDLFATLLPDNSDFPPVNGTSPITSIFSFYPDSSQADMWFDAIFSAVTSDNDSASAPLQINVVLEQYICGDANGNGNINILDITYLISYLYQGGQAPDPLDAGDANGSGTVNILDITYLIAYLYLSGPEPVCL